MEKIGYVVRYGTVKMYTCNKTLAVKVARKHDGEIRKTSVEKVKKALDIRV